MCNHTKAPHALSLFDTHCDTASELFERREHLYANTCHIGLDKAAAYKDYTQFFAIWSNRRHDDQTCFTDFLQISDYFAAEIAANANSIALAKNAAERRSAEAAGRRVAILAVEDARLLAGDLSRLEILYERGVRYLTLLWGGETCIGGSHNTESGLTDFGKQVVRRCFELGIIPDISHASKQSVDDLIPIAQEYGKPFIATHSNAYSLYPHSRNLRDRHLKELLALGGIVGVSLCPSHLRDTASGPATVKDVVDHIDRYLALGAENALGLGCDLDGTDLPSGFSSVSDLPLIADEMAARGYSDRLIRKIFYQNYQTFFDRVLC